MNNKELKDEYEIYLNDKLSSIPFYKATAFTIIFCERLSGFYKSEVEDLLRSDVEIFEKSINSLCDYVVNNRKDVKQLQMLKEAIVDMDLDYESLKYHDEIIEFADALYSCLSGVIENSIINLTKSSCKIINTILFRQIDNEFSAKNIDFSWEKIETHPLIVKEKELHQSVLESLINIDSITNKDIETLKSFVNNPVNCLLNDKT
jgi:uncharacterized protein YjaG (DUF416 family)